MFSQHSYTLTVTDGGSEYDLLIKGGTVTLDEGWSPYIQADVVCARPDAAVVEALDPRLNARVQVTLSQEFSDWNGATRPGTSFTADLGVRERAFGDDGEMILRLASDEALVQDRAHLDGFLTGTYATVFDMVQAYLSLIGDMTIEPGYPYVGMTEQVHYIDDGDVIWDALNPVVQAAGLRLFSDEQRRWWLTRTRQNSTALVRLGEVVKLQQFTDTVSRDDDTWADAVVVKYSWVVDGVTNRAVDKAQNAYPPSKVKVVEYTSAYPGPGAAQHILNRCLALGRSIDSRAVSDYSARPGMQFATSVDEGTLQAGHIASVTWSLDDDRMTITPRDIVEADAHAWAIQPPVTWSDAPAGTWAAA